MPVFGPVFTRVRAIPTGNMSYMEFMAPGTPVQSVLFIANFHGIATIWERDPGEQPLRAVLGTTDIPARPHVPAGALSFTVPWPMFLE